LRTIGNKHPLYASGFSKSEVDLSRLRKGASGALGKIENILNDVDAFIKDLEWNEGKSTLEIILNRILVYSP
jgi:hypothetical protein